ncbi:MAG: NEW3 domain-containing protein [Candidatus Methanomethylicia archaeon]
MKYIVIFILTIIFIQFSYVYALSSGELSIEDIYWMPPTYGVKPGGLGTLVVVVKNVCSREVRNIDATLDISTLSKDDRARASFRGSLEPMCTVSLVFKDIRISEDAKASQYRLSLELTYRVNGYIKTLKLKIPVALAGAPEIHLYGSTIYILPSEERSFTVTILNRGSSTARRLTVAINSLSPLLTVTSESQYRISILDVSESIDLSFSIYASSNAYGLALLRLDIVYMDELNNIYNTSRMFTAIFSVKSPHFTLVSSSYIPSRVYPGDSEVSIFVNLLNSGEDKAEDVEVSLILPKGFKSTTPSSTKAIPGTIMPGSSIQFRFYIDVMDSTASKSYNLTLNVTYKSGFQTFNIPIQVSEKASFKILSINPQNMYAGDTKVKIIVNVKNTGNVDADSVSLELIGGNRITGTTIDYLGLIEAGGEKSAIFIVDVDESTPTEDLNVKINIAWLQDGKMFTQSINATFNILKPRSLIERIKEALNIPLLPYFLVLSIISISVLVILIAVLGRRR